MGISSVVSNIRDLFFSSKKRFLGMLVGLVLLLSIPITMSLVFQPQDIRQHAAEINASQELSQLKALGDKQKEILTKESDLDGKVLSPLSSTTTTAISTAPVLSGPGITECGDITTPGSYHLDQDIMNQPGYPTPLSVYSNECIHIRDTSNVTLDCQGHKIYSTLNYSTVTPIALDNVQNFSIKNCVLYSNFWPLYLTNVSNGTIQGNTFFPITQDLQIDPLVKVYKATEVEFSNNIFKVCYRQGPDDPSADSTLSTSQINIHNNSFKAQSGATISIGGGKDNILSGNTIDGRWDGSIKTGNSDQVGSDDTIVLQNQDNMMISNNTISNAWDCGIETLGFIKDSTFLNNKITNTGYCGIGAWWYSSWLNNTVSGNIVNKSSYLFQFYYMRNEDRHEQNIYFQDNTFTNNKFSNRLNSSYLGDTLPYSSAFIYQRLAWPPGIIKIGNNVFQDNDFDETLDSPVMVDQGIAVDKGGNICKQVDALNHPLKCVTGSSLTPTPATSPTATSPCQNHSQGDANCDGKINTDDFNIWRDEYLMFSNGGGPAPTPPHADFTNDGTVNTDDFNVWRDRFLNSSLPH